VGGQKLTGLPAWPLYESLVGLLFVTGAIFYVVAVRGTARDVEELSGVAAPDAVIG
jgi:hypothetical protein